MHESRIQVGGGVTLGDCQILPFTRSLSLYAKPMVMADEGVFELGIFRYITFVLHKTNMFDRLTYINK